jgi:hypothetical protein
MNTPFSHQNPTVGCAVRTKAKAPAIVGCAAHTKANMTGLSYVEVLVAIVLITLILVPALDALSPGLAGSGIHTTMAEDHYQLTGKLERVLVEPFGQLNKAANAAGSPTTPTSYSDVYGFADCIRIDCNVFIARYDGDNADADNDPFTGTDDGLLWVQVAIPGTSMSVESLVSEYD